MHPDTPPPHSGPEQTHTTIFRGPHPIAFNPRTDLEAIGTLVRALHLTGRLRSLKRKQLPMLMALAALSNGRHFRQTGELVSWPGEVALADGVGFKRSGSVYPLLRTLIRKDLVERVTVEVDGFPREVYRLILPDPPSDGRSGEPGKVRDRRGMGARSLRARAPETGARSLRARARAHCERAQALPTSSIETSKMKQQQQHAPALPEPAADGRSAAAAAELEAVGIGPDVIQELVALETTTRERVIAWSVEGSKGHITNKPGFVIKQLRTGKPPPALSLRKAQDRLERQRLGANVWGAKNAGPVVLTEDAKRLIETELPEESKRFFREHAERKGVTP